MKITVDFSGDLDNYGLLVISMQGPVMIPGQNQNFALANQFTPAQG